MLLRAFLDREWYAMLHMRFMAALSSIWCRLVAAALFMQYILARSVLQMLYICDYCLVFCCVVPPAGLLLRC